jgi:hypothetical protein
LDFSSSSTLPESGDRPPARVLFYPSEEPGQLDEQNAALYRLKQVKEREKEKEKEKEREQRA